MRIASLRLLLVAGLALSGGPAGAQSLYWLDTNYGAPTLNKSFPDGSGVTSVPLAAGSLPEGLAVAATGKLYWAESAWSNAKLNRAAPTLTSIMPMLSGGSVLRGIAVDDAAQLLYWTTSNLITGPTISRAGMTGSGATALITLAAGANPRGIAVDHGAGRIYWADFDLNAIYRANLDGSAAAVWLALPASSGPYGVAVDPVAQLVYWTEFNTGVVKRATTAGAGVTTLVSGLTNPTYLALDLVGGRMYWIEGGALTHRIARANTSGALAMVTLPPSINTYGGIAFISDGTVSAPEAAMPSEFALDRLWPSPARGGPIHVAFSMPRATQVRLSVLDLQGREVAVLAEGVVPAGRQERLWNTGSRAVPAGIYFVRLAVDGRTWVRRVALIH